MELNFTFDERLSTIIIEGKKGKAINYILA